MTVPLAPDSPRREAAARFGAELRRAMAARRVSQKRLAEASRCAVSAVCQWKAGNNLPRRETAARLAEVLAWPRLMEIVADGQSRTCARCGRVFIAWSTRARFCSRACREVDAALRRPSHGAELAAAVRAELRSRRDAVPRAALWAALEHWDRRESRRVARSDRLADELATVQATVEAMCRDCEPDGICRTAACPLRPVSPLPLDADPVATRPIRRVQGPWGPDYRERTLSGIRSGNVRRWDRPGEREQAADVARARWEGKTAEQRSEGGRAIRAGQREEASA